ncbi:MAG: 2Fe-2S iron-sulfur cluster-binding protein [Caldiserica bacterium]|jgi:formate dehydrogenase major subunit|nr:2Fe-2S iron-sulfur cluster-binding protein [Caldisericota bacterium]MDH7562074.1 2Fe-2S iron-sulfur cluster-binding protein [Caldisericota bacterium]
MGKVRLKIDGKEMEVEEGSTLLEAARQAGVDIPTLCNHEKLLPYGACRICVVEAGPGPLKPACATYVVEGMDVKTSTKEIQEVRMTVLQLLFGERNHYCMYCESSGNCELQNLGYRFGLDNFQFPSYEDKYPVDVSHPFILFDQNRCVLCRRCARACAELGGHFVLEVKNRGYQSLINVDLNNQFAQSSCVSCGLCVQVCPTGALVDKRASYLGRKEQSETVKTNCDRCSLGCGIEVSRRANFILKVFGDWDYPLNQGVLCKNGRYLPLYDERPRLHSPKFKEGGIWTQISPDKAFSLIFEKKGSAEVFLEGSLPLELIQSFQSAFKDRVFALNQVEPPISSTATIKDLEDADTYLVLGIDLNEQFGVVGSMIKRRVIPQGAKLVAVEAGSLGRITDYSYEYKDIDTALGEAKKGKKVVVVYSSLPGQVAERLGSESGLKFLFLPYETNTLGLRESGIRHKAPQGNVKIFAGENIAPIRSPGDFIIAFTPFETPELKASADLLIPIPGYLEDEGTFINLEGNEFSRKKVVNPPEGVLTLGELSARLNNF